MTNEQESDREFADLIERRTGVRLDDAEAHALHLKLLALYRLFVHKLPSRGGLPQKPTPREFS